jgi:hypothetical protein
VENFPASQSLQEAVYGAPASSAMSKLGAY